MLIKTTNGWIRMAAEHAQPMCDLPKPDCTPDWVKLGFETFDAWLDAWADAISRHTGIK